MDGKRRPPLARTALPPHIVEQGEAKAKARILFGGRKELFDRLATVFDNAGIAQRHIVAPTLWYESSHGWKERNRLYLDACDALFREAASTAIERAGLQPSDIDGVVAVSTTGIATPSIDARNGPAIGLRADVRRVPIFGMGCAGGVNGLATAARLAAAEPGTRWLYVTIETCSISIRLDSDDPAAIVATASSAMVPLRQLSRLATAGSRPSSARASGCGRIRSISWAGGSRIRASPSCSTVRPAIHRERTGGRVDGMLPTWAAAERISTASAATRRVKVIDAIEAALALRLTPSILNATCWATAAT